MPRRVVYDPRGTPSKETEEDVGAEKWRKIFNPGVSSTPWFIWALKISNKGPKIYKGPFACLPGGKVPNEEDRFVIDDLEEKGYVIYPSTKESGKDVLKEITKTEEKKKGFFAGLFERKKK